MMAKLMELLERFVVAVEKIAEQGCCTPQRSVGAATPTVTIPVKIQGEMVDMPSAGNGTPPQAVEDVEKLKRELIKKELREKGIKFNGSLKTETLQKLLDAANQPQAKPTETVVATADMGKPAAASTTSIAEDKQTNYTIEKVREALVKVSAAKGKDEALGLLKTLGKAEKLSDVDPARYMLIIDACKVRGVTV